MSPRLALVLLLVGLLSLAGVVVGAIGAFGPGDDGRPEPAVVASPRGSEFEGAIMPDGVRAPDFSLRDQDGRPVRMRDMRGEPAIVTFLHARCEETCPPQVQQIKGALDRLGRDVPALAVAVEPDEDTPQAARHFLREQGMAGRLRFVLGSRAELEPLWRGFAVQPETADRHHQARIVLIDRRGFQRVGFPVSETTPERLAHDLRVLAAEGDHAGGGSAG